jgi:hypothetical protein
MKLIRWDELADEMLAVLTDTPRSAVGLAVRGMASMEWPVIGGSGVFPTVLLVVKQWPTCQVQRLSHGEVEAPVHGALWFSAPESPGSGPAAHLTLAVLVQLVLSE